QVLLCVLAAGCSSGSPPHVTVLPDSPPPDAPACAMTAAPTVPAYGSDCRVLSQFGCASGEKCTWIRGTGQLGCGADGMVELGCACTVGSGATNLGYDDCARGSYCITGFGSAAWTGRCALICNL